MSATNPIPVQPLWPMARGASSHSPLPIDRPRAIRLGPTTRVIVSFRPIRFVWKTSSGSGRSSTPSGGRLTPRGQVSFVGGACGAPAPPEDVSIVGSFHSGANTGLGVVGDITKPDQAGKRSLGRSRDGRAVGPAGAPRLRRARDLRG